MESNWWLTNPVDATELMGALLLARHDARDPNPKKPKFTGGLKEGTPLATHDQECQRSSSPKALLGWTGVNTEEQTTSIPENNVPTEVDASCSTAACCTAACSTAACAA